jgi:Zn finger protein HypA/HybF involved in hydrogenase expression
MNMKNDLQSSKLKAATCVVVRPVHVQCPHCNEDQDGWLVDPRGGEHVCDHCGEKYTVANDAQIKFF